MRSIPLVLIIMGDRTHITDLPMITDTHGIMVMATGTIRMVTEITDIRRD